MLRKIGGWAVIALIVVWVLQDPAASGHAVHGWIGSALTFATSLGGH
jgi:hypothetical protein